MASNPPSPFLSGSLAISEGIAGCELFRGLGGSQIEAIHSIASRRSFAAGETIFRQGDPCPGVFIVERGLARIFRSGANGQQHVLHLCGPGQSFAEVAVFADFRAPANASAVQLTQCILIPADGLQKQLAQDHQLCRQLLAGMAFWTRHFVQLLDDIVLRDASERVARFLSAAPSDAAGRVVLPGSKKDVANHLNLASETFSRVLRRLSDQEILSMDSDHSIRILDAGQLSRLADAHDA